MAKKRRYDKSEITEPSSAFDLFSNSIEKVLDFDFFDSGVTRFNAIVLTQPVLLNPRAIPSTGPLDFVLGADTLSLGKFRFFARIQGGLNSPHAFLPDPCDPAISSDPLKQLKYIKLHTEFYSTKDSSMMRPKVGDTVVVELQQNSFSYNLYVGEFVKLLDSTGGNAPALTDCSGMQSNFQNVPGGWSGGTGNGSKGSYTDPITKKVIAVTNGSLADVGLIAPATMGYGGRSPRILKDLVFSWNNLAIAFKAAFPGWKLGGSGNRTYASQVALKKKWCAAGDCKKAATPGFSKHGWGMAVDVSFYTADGEQHSMSFRLPKGRTTDESKWTDNFKAYAWLFRNGPTYGWGFPPWAQSPEVSEFLGVPCTGKCGGNPEAWHMETTRTGLITSGKTAYNAAKDAETPPVADATDPAATTEEEETDT